MPPIFFMSDFGTKDYYVSAVKAVMISINPRAKIIDITHEVRPFNIREGAFILYQLVPYLPAGSTVLAVIDPGVGTDRKAIAVRTKKFKFVGPDNGLLYPASSRDGIVEVRWIRNESLTLPRSGTFDARDIFGPIAAHLSKGVALNLIGPKLETFEKLDFGKAEFGEGRLVTETLHVDRFGNLITNVTIEEFEKWMGNNVKFKVISGKRSKKAKLVHTYSELGRELGIIKGSSGFMEISKKEGSACEVLRTLPGERLVIEKMNRS
jgi:hypothetical protein